MSEALACCRGIVPYTLQIHLIGGNMKYFLLAVLLLLSACDGPPAPAPKIAEPQRDALEKAKGVEQTLQKADEESQKKISESEGE